MIDYPQTRLMAAATWVARLVSKRMVDAGRSVAEHLAGGGTGSLKTTFLVFFTTAARARVIATDIAI